VRQVKKGTDLPLAVALIGATMRSRSAALVARLVLVICAETTPEMSWRVKRKRGS
jgi:hypothetical protein